jgi:hypothetical protein
MIAEPSLIVTEHIRERMKIIEMLEKDLKDAKETLEDEYPYLSPREVDKVERIIFTYQKMIYIEKTAIAKFKILI